MPNNYATSVLKALVNEALGECRTASLPKAVKEGIADTLPYAQEVTTRYFANPKGKDKELGVFLARECFNAWGAVKEVTRKVLDDGSKTHNSRGPFKPRCATWTLKTRFRNAAEALEGNDRAQGAKVKVGPDGLEIIRPTS